MRAKLITLGVIIACLIAGFIVLGIEAFSSSTEDDWNDWLE